jgi:SAM-dependent methyltransferase
MHKSVMEFGEEMLTPKILKGKTVLEVGSYDVNGSLKKHILDNGAKDYTGCDIRAGKNVDIVLKGDLLPFEDCSFDIIICTEVLEHCKDWKTTVHELKRVCNVGGYILLTARGPGFPIHDYPGDYWRFVPDDIAKAFVEFKIIENKEDPMHPGFMSFMYKQQVQIFQVDIEVEEVKK